MADKLRLGIIGANMRSHWASRSRFPALLASPDWEVTAVCTTRQASADEARVKMRAKLAFDDYRKMVASPEIDAVLVVVRVPKMRRSTPRVHLYGSRGNDPLRKLEVPSRFAYVSANMQAGEPYNVGQMYSRFAHAIRTGQGGHPDFDTAVGLHRFLDDIKRASDTGEEVSVEGRRSSTEEQAADVD
jgi:predicted dehydrogenase